ncbi:MAG: DNA polymerase I [Actinomycetota bacterium]|nr:DNA polymerase I [Actinomycetota bacterium]
MPTLALLDGHSLAYRAFYALPSDLATPAGQVTNAVLGFTNMLIRLLREETPDAVAVAWDVRGPTFRKERYPEYKAQREAPPDIFTSQLPLIREVLDVLHIKQLTSPGYEADDVIATVVEKAVGESWRVLVVTGDRDSFQLVDDNVTVLYTRRGISDVVTASPKWITEKYGVTPSQYREYAALRGDSSDNLPGVPGVGEKTASRLISEYRSLDGIYEHLDEQTPKLRENLAAHREQVYLNRDLMKMMPDVPVVEAPDGIEPESLLLQEWDRDEVRAVFEGLAFRDVWERLTDLGGYHEEEVASRDVTVKVAGSAQRVRDAVSPGVAAVEPVWDAGGLNGLVVATGPDEAIYVPEEHLDALMSTIDRDSSLVAHDAKRLFRVLIDAGLEMPPLGFDTALAAYIVNPGQRTPDLEDLAYRELGISVTAPEDADMAESQGAFDFEGTAAPDLELLGRRVVAIGDLVEPLLAQLEARGEVDLFRSIELPLVPILARMEANGVGVDRDFLEAFGDDLRSRLAKLEVSIHEAAGGPFNVNSTLQLREILFERLALPVLKKTPKGVPSTDASVLAKLRGDHPIVNDLLTFRELEKLRSTYVDALLPLIEPDGRVRGRFNQMAAATGRLSQEQPNLQNIPVRSAEGRAIRRAFVADEGCQFLVADYSQIELRILAHMSGDPGMVRAFQEGLDIHAATAANVNNVPIGEVDTDQRRRAKMINFGLLYGMEAYGLAQRLEIGREEAQAHIDVYFDRFPEVRDFMQGIVDAARESGYTTTLLGRRRYLPELASGNFRTRQAGERMALNAPIQGSAADIIKKAMVVLEGRLREGSYQAEMLLQIHDELVLEVPEEELEAVTELTRSVMEDIIELTVPLKVDSASGKTLADCEH